MNTSDYDVAIVGAGIVGAACALECTRAGLNSVLIEQGIEGGGATGAGMGHIVVTDDSEAQIALTRYGQRLWQELAQELPDSCEWSASGTIWIAASDDEMSAAVSKQQMYDEHDIPAEVLDSQTLARAEPHLRPGLTGGLRVPQDAVVYPPAVVDFLIKGAQQAGTSITKNARAVGIGNGCVTLDSGEELHATHIVNATGSAAAAFSSHCNVRPRKGHLLITDRYPGFITHQLVELGYLASAHSSLDDSVAFNIQPRSTGQCLIGSSRQFNAVDSDIDHNMVGQITRRAIEYMPDLASLRITRIWTGQRAATSDNLPMIGPSVDDPSVLLATGHGGLGITTALATATMIADIIDGRQSAIPIDPYLPSRVDAPEDLHGQ